MANGEIGTITLGDRQVGGFLDWEINVEIANREPVTTARLAAWWLFELPPPGTPLRMDFYRRQGDDLKLINRQTATPVFPAGMPLDTLIKEGLEVGLNADADSN
jgi:hypothetical protein